jgi:hypothetical protein
MHTAGEKWRIEVYIMSQAKEARVGRIQICSGGKEIRGSKKRTMFGFFFPL